MKLFNQNNNDALKWFVGFAEGDGSWQIDTNECHKRSIFVINQERPQVLYKIKKLVSLIETSVIQYLKDSGMNAERKQGAPGVYIKDCKIASLGLRVKKNCTYHGLSLNVDMDLTPFDGINACGMKGISPTQLIDFKKNITKSADASVELALLYALWTNVNNGGIKCTLLACGVYGSFHADLP